LHCDVFSLVENIDLFPKNDPGGISSLTKHLKLMIIPKGEYIINQGELASEMYFILQGLVEIVLDDGTSITTLGEGKYFGEMALKTGEPSLRTASIFCLTDVSVAILTIDDFNLICESYPSFKLKVFVSNLQSLD
jgi:CRP-like cAMP-binding protein